MQRFRPDNLRAKLVIFRVIEIESFIVNFHGNTSLIYYSETDTFLNLYANELITRIKIQKFSVILSNISCSAVYS